MSSSSRMVRAIVLGVVALAAAPEARDDEAMQRLSKVGGMIFVPGRLSEVVTWPHPPTDSFELSHGYELFTNLAANPGVTDQDEYLISQKPFSSYEAVVDSTSGDIGPTLEVDRVLSGTTTVLQSSQPIGVGFSRSLRWMNTSANDVNTEAVRVRSGQCNTDCGPDDVYFIRGYETTYSIPRFNNAGTQVTVLLLQNPASYAINGSIYFWDANGVLSGTSPFLVAAKGVLVLNTATVPGANGIAGTITIAHDGRYGDLSAKTVALEPATGFSFDSPALPRIR